MIATLGADAPATAQAPAPALGNYGGGAVVAPPRPIGGAGNMLIGLRATADGRLEMNVAVILACSEDAFFRATFRPIDGTFGGHGTSTRRLPGRAEDHDRVETDYRISGTISGAIVTGKISANNDIVRGGVRKRCRRSVVQWSARRPSGEIGVLPAPPGAFMNGTTSQRLRGPQRAVTLRISADATKLERALYEVTLRCPSRTLTGIYDSPKRNLPIAPDGTVSDVERFTYRTRTTITRDTERFEATVGQTGARGTFSVTSRLVNRRTGRTIGTCRSGTVAWTAAV